MGNSIDLARTDRLNDLLAEWVERREAGEQIAVEDLCLEHPELAEPLSTLVDRLRPTQWLFEEPTDHDQPKTAGGWREIAGELTGTELLDRLARLDCLSDAALEELRRTLADADGPVVAEALLRRGALTPYQLRMLCRGRGEELVLGNYVLLELVGEGGMGRVYKALHRTMNRVVALKVIRPLAQGLQWSERFQREVRATARLNHLNIVLSYDAGISRGNSYLVMEFVDGVDLATLVEREGRLPVKRVVDCVLQAAHGLAYAHGAGIVHRDVKPSNLLLDSQGKLKLLDLGLASVAEEAAGSNPSAANLTASGQVMGTVDYLAPEQALDSRQADERSDVYSLGCTLFYLLHGRPLYSRDSMVARLLAHQSAPTPSLHDGRSDVPTELSSIFARMVARARTDRYGSMQEVIDDLAAIDARLKGLSSAAAGDRAHARSNMPRRLAASTAIFVAACAAIVLVASIWQRSPSHRPSKSPGDATPAAAVSPSPLPAVIPFSSDEATISQQEWADYLRVPVDFSNSLDVRFQLVPPGEFTMGTAEEDLPILPDEHSWKATTATEAPPHSVRLTSAYYMAESEVTQTQYASVTGRNPSYFSATGNGEPEALSADTSRHPVEDVTWLEAVLFCNALSRLEDRPPCYLVDGANVRLVDGASGGYRLPTEAEWEFACRAGSAGKFCFGDAAASLRGYASYSENSDGRTRPVMTLEPNAFGLFDMHGGVWEYCYDWYDPDFYKQGSMTDPRGPQKGVVRVHRGGSWDNPPDRCRSAQRSSGPLDSHSIYRGFRLVLSVQSGHD